MTVEEKRKQRVEVELDLETAENDLAHCQVKVIRHAEALEAVAQKLHRSASLEPSPHDFSPEYDSENRLVAPDQAALDYAQAVKLIGELKLARQKVVSLRSQKRRLTAGALVIE